MSSLSPCAESYVCHVTDKPKGQPQRLPGYPQEEHNANLNTSKTEILSYLSVSSHAPGSELKGSGVENASTNGSGSSGEAPAVSILGTEGMTPVATSEPAVRTTMTTEALLVFPPQPLPAEEQVPPVYAEAEEAGGKAAERVTHMSAEELSSSDRGGMAAPVKPFTGATTSSERISAVEGGSPGIPVAPCCSSDPTQGPAVSNSLAEAASRLTERENDRSRVLLGPISNAYVRGYTLSQTASSSSPRSPPAHLVVHRCTPERSTGPMWGTTPVSPPGAVQCEKLVHLPVGSKKKYELLSGSSRTTPRGATSSVPALTFTSRSMPASTHAPIVSSMTGSTTAMVVVPTEASLQAAHPSEDTMKDLVSHLDRHSFGFHLREMFQRADFAGMHCEVRRGVRESTALQEYRRLFRVLAKNKDSMSVEDLHELLLIFTPCGVSLREGADFLWENCGGKSSLTFRDFLQYGPALRARLQDYEVFERLPIQQKLITTHARVLPGVSPSTANSARLQLLRVAEQQVQGQLPRHTRPLRLYEEIFLVDYQQRLYDAALIPASDVPPQRLKSDYAHEYGQQQYTRALPPLPQLSVPVLMKEDMVWCHTEAVCSPNSDASEAARHAAAVEKPATVLHGKSEHQAVSRNNRLADATKAPGKAGSRTASKKKNGQGRERVCAASSMGAGATYGDSSRQTGLVLDRSAVVVQQQPRPQEQKKMGRFVEEEYWERRIMDDHLITQLQSMYRTP
ncbi:hypothetical protein NXY56_005148 [Leishmania guyanensis]